LSLLISFESLLTIPAHPKNNEQAAQKSKSAIYKTKVSSSKRTSVNKIKRRIKIAGDKKEPTEEKRMNLL
jgi:hypothetical protein